MKTLSKLLILLFFFGTCLNVSATTLNVEKFGNINKVGDKLSQPVNISFVSDGEWKLLVEAIDSKIRNISSVNKSLPITRLEIAESSGSPLAHFEMGRSFEVKRGASVGSNSFNLYLNALNYVADYPGNYIVDLKFTLMNSVGEAVSEEIYTFRFNQEEVSSIDFDNPTVNLQVSGEKALKIGYQESLSHPFSIYVSSNKDWKLYLLGRKSDDKNLIDYYFRVTGASSSLIDYDNSGDYAPMKDTKILVAKGHSTVDENTNQLLKEVINIDYMVKGPEDDILPAGNIITDFEYIIETEE